jgi:hypothetical protein
MWFGLGTRIGAKVAFQVLVCQTCQNSAGWLHVRKAAKRGNDTLMRYQSQRGRADVCQGELLPEYAARIVMGEQHLHLQVDVSRLEAWPQVAQKELSGAHGISISL